MNLSEELQQQFVTMMVGGYYFGISVYDVQDVLTPQPLTHIPLAPQDVEGALNLRGRIVTAINMGRRLGLPEEDRDFPRKSIVVEVEDRLYSLVVDAVGEVMTLEPSQSVPLPENITPEWREFSQRIYPLEGSLLIIIDVEKLLH